MRGALAPAATTAWHAAVPPESLWSVGGDPFTDGSSPKLSLDKWNGIRQRDMGRSKYVCMYVCMYVCVYE